MKYRNSKICRIRKINPAPGTYALILTSKSNKTVFVGKLGNFRLQKGYYIYVGSAFGPGGLRPRIERHKRSAKRLHWHIDYLRQFTNFENVWYSYNKKHREHQWVRLLTDMPGITIPFKNFGSSDCKCYSHLFYSIQKPLLKEFHKYLNKFFPEDEIILSLSFKGK